MRVLLLILLLADLTQGVIIHYQIGGDKDVCSKCQLRGPVLNLVGGRNYVRSSYQETINQIREYGVSINVVVISLCPGSSYNDYLFSMNGVQSVDTFVLDQREDSDDTFLLEKVRKAELVVIRGGDQCQLIKFIKGTPLQAAIEYVYSRGGGIAGIGAASIVSPYIYDACQGSAVSEEALKDPYHEVMTYTYGFFNFRYLSEVFIGQLTMSKNRLGRHLASMARQIQDGKVNTIWGLAMDEDLSVFINPDGVATIIQDTYDFCSHSKPAHQPVVYWISTDHTPEVCEKSRPLTYLGFKVWKMNLGDTFNLSNLPSSNPDYIINVVNGTLTFSGHGFFA